MRNRAKTVVWSPGLAVAEAAFGGAAAASNIYLAATRPNQVGYALLAALDTVVIAHGVHVLVATKAEKPPMTYQVGRARGSIRPAVVSTGTALVPAVTMGGTF